MTEEEKLIKLAASKHEIKLTSQDILNKYQLEGSKKAHRTHWVFGRPKAWLAGSLLSFAIICAIAIPSVIETFNSSDIAVDSTTSITGDSSLSNPVLAIAPSGDDEVVGFEILSSVGLFAEDSASSINLNTKMQIDTPLDKNESSESLDDIVTNYEKIESVVQQASNIDTSDIVGSLTQGAYEGEYGTYDYKLTYEYSHVVLYYNLINPKDESEFSSVLNKVGHGMTNHFGSSFEGEIVDGEKIYPITGDRKESDDGEQAKISLKVEMSANRFYYVDQMINEGQFSYDYLLYESLDGGDYYQVSEYYSIKVLQYDNSNFHCRARVFNDDDYSNRGNSHSSHMGYEYLVTKQEDSYLIEYGLGNSKRLIHLYYENDAHRYVDDQTKEEIIK
ncbi:MAG: hypothetical protein PHW22_02020 [Bacilli bacterium]|nr:hypothetical protein [Bacilli bacterium]